MNCNEAQQYWNLYHDSEGDPTLHFQISEHLAVCPDCAEWFAGQSRLEALLTERLRGEGPTAELWQHIYREQGLEKSEPARRRLWLPALAAVVVVAVGVLALWRWWSPAPNLAQLSAQWHAQFTAGQRSVEFVNESDQAVEHYLRQRVPFPVRCPPRKDAGFHVQGAGVYQVAHQPVAYLIGQVEQQPVSIFILSRDSLEAFPHQREAVQRERRHRCREGPYEMVLGVHDTNVVLVVGQAQPEQLERVLNAYGSYPEEHH